MKVGGEDGPDRLLKFLNNGYTTVAFSKLKYIYGKGFMKCDISVSCYYS